MRKILDGICYYLSCMLLFNIIYALSIAGDEKALNISDGILWQEGNVTFILVCLLAIGGVVSSLIIIYSDDSIDIEGYTGRNFNIKTVRDLTGETYFSNFSVIVLTSIALPSDPSWFTLIIVVLIEISLGIVYINNGMYYMNPILSLKGYRVYECTSADCESNKSFDGLFYFITKGIEVTEANPVRYKNIESHIIRLNVKKKS